VTFTPADSVDYITVTTTVQISVTKGAPTTITWPTPAEITYGTPLSDVELNATASEPGTFGYTPSVGEVLTPGTHTLTVVFTPTDTNFPASEASVPLVVQKASPVITWPPPSPIPCGTSLSEVELNATASVGGTFEYSPGAGSVPRAGIQTLSVVFTPNEGSKYTSAQATVKLTVTKAKPVITWTTPAPITYGTPLSEAEFNATASVPGSFSFTPAKGTVLTTGTQTLEAVFTPQDIANYDTAHASVPLVVTSLPNLETLTRTPVEADVDDISRLLQVKGAVAGPMRRIQNSSLLEEAAHSAGARYPGPENSNRNDRGEYNAQVLQTGNANNRTIEPETRTYKGATYVKGNDGQWHLKQN